MGVASYRSVIGEVEAEIEVKRSRFRCALVGVGGEDDARALIERIRKEHWDARHHCTAFRLGSDPVVERSSDDGEPAGTAGAPMLEVLRGRDMSDAVAVVTRWFGGVLLGAGGLVRAYGDVVRAALDAAAASGALVERSRRLAYAVVLDHADAGRVESALRAAGVAVIDMTYAERMTLTVAVPVDEADRIAVLVAGLTAGCAVPVAVGERWVDGPV